MKKSFIWVMIVILSVFILFLGISCKKEVTAPAEEKVAEEVEKEEVAPAEEVEEVVEPITLVFWWWGEAEAPGLRDWLMETVSLYELENPNITIEAVEQTAEGLYEAFTAAASAQEGPDIQYLWGGMFSMEQSFLGNFAPISDYISEDALNDIFTRDEQLFKGKIWSCPWYTLTPVFVYNKEIFKEAGLDPEDIPFLWDDFLSTMAAIKEAGHTPLLLGNAEQWAGEFMPCALAIQNSNNIADFMEVFADENKDYADPKYSEWWYRFADLRDNGYINEDVNTMAFYQSFDAFKNGEGGYCQVVSTSLADIINTMGVDNVGILPRSPSWGTGKLNDGMPVISQSISITSWSKHKEEAGKFIEFLHSKDIVNDMYLASGVLPADLKFDTSLLKTPQEKMLFEVMSEAALPYYSGFVPPYFTENALYRIGTDFLTGSSVEEVIADCKNVINDFMIKQPDVLSNYKEWYEGYKE